MEKIIFIKPSQAFSTKGTDSLPEGYKLAIFKPALFKVMPICFIGHQYLGWRLKVLSLLWWFLWLMHPITRFHYSFFIVLHKNKPVCYVGVSAKYFAFSYLNKNDLQMGPATTKHEHRGKGLYSFLLRQVVQEYNGKHSLWGFTDVKNAPVKHTFEKLHFQIYGTGFKKKRAAYGIFSSYVVENRSPLKSSTIP